jgi:hypothetical protein
MIPVRERHQFAEAIKTKIIREIAGSASEALIVPGPGATRAQDQLRNGTLPVGELTQIRRLRKRPRLLVDSKAMSKDLPSSPRTKLDRPPAQADADHDGCPIQNMVENTVC